MQLIGTPIGAAAVSWMYPLLRDTYGIVGEQRRPDLADFAQVGRLRRDLSQGLSALPPGAVTALVIGAILGVVLAVLEQARARKWVPSPTGMGIAMLVPASVIFVMFLGGLVELIWREAIADPTSATRCRWRQD